MANSSFDLTSLDFDAQKESFKNFIRSQEVFRDYDFEGSNLSMLLDILSYNSFKNAFLINMLMSEAFLDSAQIRNSVLSHAKELNYLPRSSRSAVAKVKVSFRATGESAPYVVPKGKPFTTLVKNQSFTFTNPETLILSSTNTSFSFTTDIYEGVFVQDSYTYLSTTETQKFKITNPNVDTRSLAVVVYEDNKEVGDNYRLATSLLDVKSTSKVYFLQPSEDGKYEVIFGDGNIGRKPKDNSIIVIEYRVSAGTLPNGAKRFSCDFDPTGNSELLGNITVDLLEIARDGSVPEDIESIKYYAPRHFQVQERAITASDFEISLKTAFPEINAVHAYGGEDLDPPQYGRVIVAVDIQGVEGFPEAKKKEYYNFLKRRTAFTIEPIFTEPEFSYLAVQSIVRFNVNITASTAETIKALVTDAINAYRDENLNDFDSILRFSKLAASIDEADPSIVSSITDVWLYKKISPVLGTRQNIEINFNVPLRDDVPGKEKNHKATDIHTVFSSAFQYNGEQCIIEDDGDGIIRLMKVKGDKHETINEIGTVDYSTGKIVISNFLVDQYYGDFLKVYVYPKDKDVLVSKNTILTIEADEIDVSIEELRL